VTTTHARRPLRRLTLALVGTIAAALAAVTTVTLPPRATSPPEPAWAPRLPGTVVRGTVHLHTSRSDGSGSLDEVAAAAARAGQDFLIVTDHGDGTRAPEPPAYRRGVLVVDAVEISTEGGHVAALGLPRAPYPLAGDPRGVLEDVHRLGGFAVATHPDSTKRALRWRDWTLPIDGFEWLSADSEWRDEAWRGLLLAGLHYLFRPPETIASVFDRPEALLAGWDAAGATGRRLVGLAGADAHARLGLRGGPDDGERGSGDGATGFALEVPSYESVFRAFSTRVVLDVPLSGDAERDAPALLAAVRAGRVFSSIDGLARSGAFEFFAEGTAGITQMGGTVRAGGAATLHVRAAAPAGAMLVLLENGRPVARSSGVELAFAVPDDPAPPPRAYRAEVRLPGPRGSVPVPWIAANPIFVGVATELAEAPPVAPRAASVAADLLPAGSLAGWTLEHDRDSAGELAWDPGAAPPGGLAFTYRLAERGTPTWTALARRVPDGTADVTRIGFAGRASSPVRISVQVRQADATRDRRWRQSVYLDAEWRDVLLPLEGFRPVTTSLGATPRGRFDGLLFVIDQVHAAPGASGTLWLRDVRLER